MVAGKLGPTSVQWYSHLVHAYLSHVLSVLGLSAWHSVKSSVFSVYTFRSLFGVYSRCFRRVEEFFIHWLGFSFFGHSSCLASGGLCCRQVVVRMQRFVSQLGVLISLHLLPVFFKNCCLHRCSRFGILAIFVCGFSLSSLLAVGPIVFVQSPISVSCLFQYAASNTVNQQQFANEYMKDHLFELRRKI